MSARKLITSALAMSLAFGSVAHAGGGPSDSNRGTPGVPADFLCASAQYQGAGRGQATHIICTWPDVHTDIYCPGFQPEATIEVWDQMCHTPFTNKRTPVRVEKGESISHDR